MSKTMTEPTIAEMRTAHESRIKARKISGNFVVPFSLPHFHRGVLLDRMEAAEEKLAWGVSLPKITKKLHDEFGDTCLMDAEEWSQIAVDFAGVLNSTLLSEEQDNGWP